MWLFEVVKEVTLTSVKWYNHLWDERMFIGESLILRLRLLKSKFCIGLLVIFLLLLFFIFLAEKGLGFHIMCLLCNHSMWWYFVCSLIVIILHSLGNTWTLKAHVVARHQGLKGMRDATQRSKKLVRLILQLSFYFKGKEVLVRIWGYHIPLASYRVAWSSFASEAAVFLVFALWFWFSFLWW